MSPTVPPISVITTSTVSSAARARIRCLISFGDVRDHLHGVAEVVAAALLGEHRLVDRSGGRVRSPGERHVDEALVVSEVEVGLTAVVGDEHLAVLEGVHRAGVDVDVGVELLHRDPQAPGLEQPPERGGGEPLSEARCHATGHEDVLRQDSEFSRATTRENDRWRPYHAAPQTSRTATVPRVTATAMPRRARRAVTCAPGDARLPALAGRRAGPRARRGRAAAPRVLRRRGRSCSTTACSLRRRWRCAAASCRSATCSRVRGRCSSRWSGSPISSGSARSTRPAC